MARSRLKQISDKKTFQQEYLPRIIEIQNHIKVLLDYLQEGNFKDNNLEIKAIKKILEDILKSLKNYDQSEKNFPKVKYIFYSDKDFTDHEQLKKIYTIDNALANLYKHAVEQRDVILSLMTTMRSQIYFLRGFIQKIDDQLLTEEILKRLAGNPDNYGVFLLLASDLFKKSNLSFKNEICKLVFNATDAPDLLLKTMDNLLSYFRHGIHNCQNTTTSIMEKLEFFKRTTSKKKIPVFVSILPTSDNSDLEVKFKKIIEDDDEVISGINKSQGFFATRKLELGGKREIRKDRKSFMILPSSEELDGDSFTDKDSCVETLLEQRIELCEENLRKLKV